jgi:hypothetical protein
MRTAASQYMDDNAEALATYIADGAARAKKLGNRGPARFTADGKLAPDIVETYNEVGFYIFEQLFDPEELALLRAEMHAIHDRLPTGRASQVDRHGRAAIGVDQNVSPFMWSKPLADPQGGTPTWKRAPIKMLEGRPSADAPDEIVYIMRGILQYADAALRAYGNPKLLATAATLIGDDFAPFSEAYVIKEPGRGSAFAWHQDGMTHWESPKFTPHTHGFSFMTQLYPSTAENGVWFLPGTHRTGKVDIPAMIDAAGGNLIPDAVPLVCDPGDVAISNRQTLHGSFPNMTKDWRVTLNMGFFPYDSVIGVTSPTQLGPVTFDDAHVRKRAELIGYAIDARRQYYPDETPYIYKPHQKRGETFRWNEDARPAIRAYHERDISI